MSKILALQVSKTSRYAHDGEPAKPQIQLYEGMEYEVPGEVPLAIAKKAVEIGCAQLVEVEVQDEPPKEPVFDVATASRDELKAFVKAHPELDEEVSLSASTDTIREAVSDYLQAQV